MSGIKPNRIWPRWLGALGLSWVMAAGIVGSGCSDEPEEPRKQTHIQTAEKGAAKAPDHQAPAAPLSAEDARARLKAGNEAFRQGMISVGHLTAEHRASLTAGQHPFAIVLSCSDSRVPPEAIFSQGLGDLFVVRVAGNIAEPATVASIEYAIGHVGASLLVILGHTDCGAVKAAIAGAHDTPNLTELVSAIRPALQGLPKETLESHPEVAVEANVSRVHSELLRQSDLVTTAVRENRLKVAEAIYDLKTGQVTFLDETAQTK